MMTQATVTMDVRTVNDSVSIIDIQGEINAFVEDELMDAYNRASVNGTQAIALNFSELAYMNSGGIGLLVTLLIRAQRQGQQLLAYGLNEHYQQIFELTRLNEAITIFPTEAQALGSLS
jgi:anti-sigma B factor antagonist